jgi:hypothetical protein
MTVVLYHNMVAPYRHDLFEAIAKRLPLEVWYSTRTTRDRQWDTRIPPSYPHRILGSRIWYAFRRPLIQCPSLIADLDRTRP